MKIRKKTSFMLLAASTAAVVGVAAVSFAAWQGGTNSLTASASTGNVSLVGFKTVSDGLSAYNGTEKVNDGAVVAGYTYQFDKLLLPYNQENVTDETMSTVISGKLTYEVSGDYEIVVKVADSQLVSGTKVYVNLSATAVTSVDSDALAAGQKTWTEVSTTAEAKLNVSQEYAAAAVTYISVIMDSSDNNDMNKSFSLSIELKAKASA